MVMLHYSRLLSWEVVSFLMVPRGGHMAQANVSVDLPLLLGNVRRSPCGQFSGAVGEEFLGVLNGGLVYF